jgi:ABC-2 type transport system permease protein
MRTYLLEIRSELLKAVRLPAYSIPTLLFPVLFYFIFGIMLGSRSVGRTNMAEYLIATYGTFGVIGASLFGFGVFVAVERGQGWLEVKRTTPMPIAAYFVAKLVMAAAFSTIVVGLLLTVGTLFGGVHLQVTQMLALYGIYVCGSVTFCSLGLALGFVAGPNSAAPMVNLLYLPMSVLSGLWIPIDFLPRAVQDVALWLPPYHFAQLALKVIGASRGEPAALHAGSLAAAAILFLALAWLAYRRDEGKLYG